MFADTTLPEEVLTNTRSDRERMADEAVKVAIKQLEEGIKRREGRFAEIAKNEAVYNGEKTKALRGRNNVPFDSVVARGYVDTLQSKIDEDLNITFERSPGRQQDKKPAQKVSAMLDFHRGPDQGAWHIKDIGTKKLAIFSGRGINKKYSYREGAEFQDEFEVVDHYDFYCEGTSGFLDKNKYKGQMNVLRSTEELRGGAKSGTYNSRQVEKLVRNTGAEDQKQNEEIYQHKVSRALTMGVDFQATNFVGAQMHRLVEHVMLWRGKWWYMVFNYDKGIWVRFEPLEDVFSVAKKKPGRGPWTSWATNFDPFNFWSLAPMDSIRPIAHAMKKVVNLSLDNLEKRNWGHRAYDPNVFDPKDLIFKHDGLAKAKIRTGPGQSISNHVYTFETPDTTQITVNLTEWMDNFLGRQTGITPEARGSGQNDKVGIYVGNIQQVADRLGLTNKMYEQAHVDIAVNYFYGLLDHMPERYAVQVIGNEGVEWNEELKRQDILGKEFAVRIRGSDSEEKLNVALMQRKEAALDRIAKIPQLAQRTNSSWLLREVLTIGGYDAEDIRVAQDTNNDATDDLLAEAAQAIEDIVEGKTPKLNRGATTGYVRKILDYAYDTEGLEDALFKKLVDFANKHVPVAAANMRRKAISVIASAGASGPLDAGRGGAPGGPSSALPADMANRPAFPSPAAAAPGPGAPEVPAAGPVA